MTKIFKKTICLLSLFLANVNSYISAELTPTEAYLTYHPLHKIEGLHYEAKEFYENLPFFLKVVSKEKQAGFFGYHGCSQRYRIFQDILRAVFEESFKTRLPEDFQFLRIPGEALFDLKKNKEAYYQLCDRKPLSKEEQLQIIDLLFISKFNDEFNMQLTAADLSHKERKKLWEVVLDFLETLDLLAIEDYFSFDDTATPEGLPLPVLKPSKFTKKGELSYELYAKSVEKRISTTVKFIERQEHEAQPASKFNKKFFQSSKAKNVLIELFKSRITSPQQEDKLRIWTEEEVKFKNLLISCGYSFEFYRFFFPYSDHLPEQQSRLVAMNIPLFGNYHRWGECTTVPFLNGGSIAYGDMGTDNLLGQFFVNIGYERGLAHKLYLIAAEEFQAASYQQGALLQFFDHSHYLLRPAFAGLDQTAFASHSFGIPIKPLKPSELVTGAQALSYNNMDFQLRLVTSNYTTLNPQSFLRIKRHDLLDPEISARIISRMKEALRKAPVDQTKQSKYLNKIKKLWKAHP